MQTHSECPAVATIDLLIENEKLQAKLKNREAELMKPLQQIMSTKVELEHFKNQFDSMEKALKRAQHEANTHAHATQELISAKLAAQAQVKPLVGIAEYATNNVEAAIVAAQGEYEEETAMKHATQV